MTVASYQPQGPRGRLNEKSKCLFECKMFQQRKVRFYGRILGPLQSYNGAASSSGSGNKPRPLRSGGGGRAICGDPGIQELITLNIFDNFLQR